jgi:hypothetical protein
VIFADGDTISILYNQSGVVFPSAIGVSFKYAAP